MSHKTQEYVECLNIRPRHCLWIFPLFKSRCKERVKETEYSRNVMYSCMKMEK
jgi:hypothetical protein